MNCLISREVDTFKTLFFEITLQGKKYMVTFIMTYHKHRVSL